jgi:fructosamine-3-kinase
MFEAEHDGLEELLAADALRVPRPLATGVTGGCAWIAMEWIETGRSRHGTARDLGLGLARQHRCLAEKFGWARDNTIGSTPQANGWFSEWVEFYSQRRIRYQLDLAARNSYPGRLLEAGERLLQCVGDFFSDYRPEPSLLHGDLWGGNWAADAEGRPFLFDPAVYYGDREADLAMTELFGGFDAEFYAAYRDAWPLDAGYRTRRDLYNLYHVLNHLNLFGSGYLGQSEALLGRLIAALRG